MMMNYLASLVLYGFLVLEFSYAAIYTHNWAVHIKGGEEEAKQIIERHGFVYLGKIMDDYYHIHHPHVAKRSIEPSLDHHSRLDNDPEVLWLEQQVVKSRVKRDVNFNDPKWPRMWYLQRGAGLDMNVEPAWKKGVTGLNIVVSILDDGIEKDHPDLKRNYDPLASYDVNGHDPDPQPRYDYTNENRHGTRCAGEVAAEADNHICSVGVAYNAKIGGVRMLDGDVTDAVEAQSLSLNPHHIDIYSASWGPDDDGRTVDGPAVLAKKAFFEGINTGRGGKGSIFVWASGNGGRDGDSCNCDGYTNSIYTLSISSATENGNIPWYSEACSSTLATTYSSGSGGERQIVTTDLRKGCTETHTGTSASAPLAAGVCALALEVNPQLTWRDMQHIVVQTARPENLRAKDWVINGVGRRVSHSFGYGLMDASGMVDLARNWTIVPEQHICTVKAKINTRGISVYGKIKVTLETDGCRDDLQKRVVFLEHVQSRITLASSRRGEVQIALTSPAGTRSILLQRRSRDTSTEGFNDWAFMTVHKWGELAEGTWTLEVTNGDSTFGASRLHEWTLVLYGTASHPYIEPTSTVMPETTAELTTAPTRKQHKFFSIPKNAITLGPCKPPTSRTSASRSTAPPQTTSETSSTTSAELRSWTLILYGTATHAAGGRSQAVQEGNRTCKVEQYMLNRQCYDSCPGNFYPTAVNYSLPSTNSTPPVVFEVKVCEQCHVNCSLCFGGKADQCSSCATDFFLHNSTCLGLGTTAKNPSTNLTHKLIFILALIVSSSILVFVLVFVALHLWDHGCRWEPHYKTVSQGIPGLVPGTSERRLLDSESESSDEEEHYARPNGSITLDLTGYGAKFSPTQIPNGYHQSKI